MTVKEIMAELKANGSESIRNILLKHGVKEPLFGVKIEFLKTILKKTKTNYQLALDLYATGNADAMYLAGLMADDNKMTKANLQLWVEQAVSQNISEFTVPWVAAEGKLGYEMALQWIPAKEEHIAAAGWATLANLVALKADAELDLANIKLLLQTVARDISNSPDRVRSAMNAFVIAVGVHVKPLHDEAVKVAKNIGSVSVDRNRTGSKVPDAMKYISKAAEKGMTGKKKKTVKC